MPMTLGERSVKDELVDVVMCINYMMAWLTVYVIRVSLSEPHTNEFNSN